MPMGERISSASPPVANAAINAVAPTKLGNTSGSGDNTRRKRRPGRSVRIVSHASPVPTTTDPAETVSPSHNDRRKGSNVSADQMMEPTSVPRSTLRETT